MTKAECSEQIQEDVRTYVEAQFAYDDESGEAQELCDHLCQIVVDNFKSSWQSWDKIYIKVEDGMLNKVYSENPNLEVILYDLDQDDPDKFDEVVESWKEVEDRKLTELLDHE